ncbi:MAG: hypothetical protein M3P29_06440 [Acidobacteriota bacterium]|nr:hypothetical protein [Acidobacteriota bacterium]
MRLTAIVVASFLCAAAAAGQQSVSYERVLLPVVITSQVPGAFGSQWTTRVSILNNSGQGVDIQGYAGYPRGCPILCGQPITLAGITFYPSIAPGAITQGAILRIDRRYSDNVEVHLRVQDVSRQSQTWGTEVPVVREKGLYQSTMNLLDVPIGAAFRQRLRIYDVDARQDARVRVRFYRVNAAIDTTTEPFNPQPPPDLLLAERTVQLTTEQRAGTPTNDLGYAEISNVGALPELQNADRIRIEVTSLTTGLRFWSFVSVTNNDTQHVTILSPH